MRIQSLCAAIAFAALSAQSAAAAEVCNAATHEKYGETRAFFQDVIAGCDKAKSCYVATHVADDGQGLAYRQQVRIRREAADTPYRLYFVGVDPMPAARGVFAFSAGDRAWNLSSETTLTPQSGNEFELNDLKLADQIIAILRGAKQAAWLYPSEKGGSYVARFGVRGAGKALAWVACMQKPKT